MKGTVRILALLISVLSAATLSAQNNSPIIQHRTHIWHLAPVIGRTVSTLSMDSVDHIDGFSVGASFIYRHKRKHVSTSISALYSSRGADWDRSHRGQYGETYNFYFYEQLRYLEVPLKFTYLFFSDSTAKFRPKISAGGSFMWLLDAKRTSEFKIAEWFTSSEPETVTVMDQYKPFDLGAFASIGFNYEFRHRRIFCLEAGYTHGMLDISKNLVQEKDVMNRNIFIIGGIELPLIRKRFR